MTLSPADELTVDAAWREARVENHRLFDARVLTITEPSARPAGRIDLVGRFAPYRYVLAQRRLGRDFGLATIGVTGVCLMAEDGAPSAVIARRSSTVTDYPGFLELVPSGGLSAAFARPDGMVDYTGQLAEEFVEETGLPASAAVSIQGFALLLDHASRTYDIACRIALRPGIDRRTIEDAFSRSGEYAGRPQLVPVNELSGFAARHQDEFVPTSSALIEALNA